jgi:G3E family GTPase
VCCTVRGDLIRVINGLMKRKGGFDGVVIETTGLADPAPVAQTFFLDDEVKRWAQLDAVVTVVDAYHFLERVEESAEAEEQVAFADVILLNKTDLVSPDRLKQVEAKIRKLNRFAEIHKTERCTIALDKVLDRHAFDLDRILEIQPKFLEPGHDHDHDHHDHDHDHDHHHHKHGPDIASVSLSLEKPLNRQKFEMWIGTLLREKGQDILRSKGILDFAGEAKRFVFQGVHMLIDGQPGRAWTKADRRWSQLVFIGRELDAGALRRGFEACVA